MNGVLQGHRRLDMSDVLNTIEDQPFVIVPVLLVLLTFLLKWLKRRQSRSTSEPGVVVVPDAVVPDAAVVRPSQSATVAPEATVVQIAHHSPRVAEAHGEDDGLRRKAQIGCCVQ